MGPLPLGMTGTGVLRRLSLTAAFAGLAGVACESDRTVTHARRTGGSAGSADAGRGGSSGGAAGRAGSAGRTSTGGTGVAAEGGDAGVPSSGGTGGSGGTSGGSGGRGGSRTGGAGGSNMMNGGEGGMDDGGGGGAGGTSGLSGGGGAAGSGGDIITVTGGIWPDSATGACTDGMVTSACPARGGPFFGQDGTYRVTVPTYTLTTGTAVDSVTGLEWELDPDLVTTQTHDEAVTYCDALSLGGYDDWRLPSRLEYVTVLDVGRPEAGRAMPVGFNVVDLGAHWTSTAAVFAANAFFIVNDRYGLVSVTNGTSGTRCVRGPGLSGSLTVGTETVTDSMTGLEWQRTALDDTLVTWGEALAYCEALTHAAHDDWRLPNLKELVTILDELDATAPLIDETAFGASAAARYWSSTPGFSGGTGAYAAYMQTDVGATPTGEITMAFAAARCVRQAGGG